MVEQSEHFSKVLDRNFDFILDRGVEDLDYSAAQSIADAWERAGSWRLAMLMMFLRKIGRHPDIDTALPRGIDFVFRFMGVRFIGLFFDGLCSIYRYDTVKAKALYRICKHSPYHSLAKEEAALYGMTGSHYYNPERYESIEQMDRAT